VGDADHDVLNGMPPVELCDRLLGKGGFLELPFLSDEPAWIAARTHRLETDQLRQRMQALLLLGDQLLSPADRKARREEMEDLGDTIRSRKAEGLFLESAAEVERRVRWAPLVTAVRTRLREGAGAVYWREVAPILEALEGGLAALGDYQLAAGVWPFTDAPALPRFDGSPLAHTLHRLHAAFDGLPKPDAPLPPMAPAREPRIPLRLLADLPLKSTTYIAGEVIDVSPAHARVLIAERRAIVHAELVELGDFDLDCATWREQRHLPAAVPGGEHLEQTRVQAAAARAAHERQTREREAAERGAAARQLAELWP